MKQELHLNAGGKVRSARTVYQGRAFAFIEEDVDFSNGCRATAAFVKHPGSVAVVPLFADGTVALALQYRHPVRAYLWEIPAGTRRAGETPEACARRELQEETGLVSEALTAIGEVHILPSYSDERISIFLATQLTSGQDNLDADEMIVSVVRYPFDALFEMIDRGEITCALTILALHQASRYLAAQNRRR